MINTNWYVLSGGPCVGKTKLIESLANLGYATTPEVPRVLIDAEMKKGKTIQEIRVDEAEFQKRVFKMKLMIENKIPASQVTFIDDGGIPNSIAYYQITGLDPAPVIKEAQKRKYKGVFFLERLPFEKDYARTEDEETAQKLRQLLYQTYQDLGYNIIKVPVKPLEERVKFILNEL